jgi:hypothetical protein
MPRCPDGFHRSPDGDCESVRGDNDEEEDNDKDDDKDDDFSDISDNRESRKDDDSFLFTNTFESEFNENLASNVEIDDNSIPSNIIDDIMRKHQQFAFTLGSPSSDILSTGDSKGYYQKYYNGYILRHPEFGAHEVHGGISDKWNNLDRENGILGYPISDEHDTNEGSQSDSEKGHITWLQDSGEITVFMSE